MSPLAVTGRAGRLQLKHRLAVARGGVDLLERKQRVIAAELERLELQRERTAEQWETAWSQAVTWLQRCTALDGVQGLDDAVLDGVRGVAERAADAAVPGEAAQAEVDWGCVMGVTYPRGARCLLPPARPVGGSAALAPAVSAHRRAVEAGVRHAAATRAVSLLGAELATTRALRKSIETRLVPRLEQALHDLEVRLDETDREENLRMRWSAGTREG